MGNMTCVFEGYDCCIETQVYLVNQQPVLRLVATDTRNNAEMGTYPGEVITTATACVPACPFKPGETAIKDYSENAGILQLLIEAGIVEPTGRTCMNGFIDFPIVKVLISVNGSESVVR